MKCEQILVSLSFSRSFITQEQHQQGLCSPCLNTEVEEWHVMVIRTVNVPFYSVSDYEHNYCPFKDDRKLSPGQKWLCETRSAGEFPRLLCTDDEFRGKKNSLSLNLSYRRLRELGSLSYTIMESNVLRVGVYAQILTCKNFLTSKFDYLVRPISEEL